MTLRSHSRRPALGLLAAISAALLASCQTSADEVLSLGDSAPSEEISARAPGGKSFRDPYVVAVSGQPAAVAEPAVAQNDTDPARLKRKPVPLAAAYTDIAEPPPEVLALQQAAQAQTAGQAQVPPQAQADLGEITMRPTAVNAGSNSLFSAGRSDQQRPAEVGIDPSTAQPAAGSQTASASLVPGDMPTLGINAVRKSLFSPSAEQQALMQQQALQEQVAPPAADGAPLTESAATSGEETPVLKKLSDPRPKRKILALRETAPGVPERVQLSPDQLQAMGAVQEFDPAEPLPEEERTVTEAAPPGKKKTWLPSLSELLKGGKTKDKAAVAP